MAKIGWLSDYFYPNLMGGAEISDYTFMQEAKRHGHEITKVLSYSEDMPADLDFVIVSNTALISPLKIEWLIKQRFIMRLHDIRDMPHYNILFQYAEAIVFLSPMHELLFKERHRLPQTLQIPNTLIDINKYKPLKKKHRAVYLGNLTPVKGFGNIIGYAQQHPEIKIDAYGKTEAGVVYQNLPANLKIKGQVPHSKIPKILGEAEYYIFLLSEPGTFSLSCLEAYLSGCRFITNTYEGMWTWNLPWSKPAEVKAILKKAPSMFWDFISKRLALETDAIQHMEKVREQAMNGEAKKQREIIEKAIAQSQEQLQCLNQ